MKRKDFKYYDLIMAFFVTVLLLSNLMSSAKIIDWGLTILGIRLSFDAGTILFPLSYVFGDILTEVYGYRRSRRVIWAGFACLGVCSLVLNLVKVLPGETHWQDYAGQEAFDAILGGMTSGGIVVASLVGYWAGEFSNSFVLAKMKILTKGRWLWTRTIGSTLVGQGVDTVAFVSLATFFGVFPVVLLWSLVITNYLFKVGVEITMTPMTYWVANSLKEAENEDYYDVGTDFNPFNWQDL